MAIVTDGLNATFLIILFADVNYISNSGVGVFIRFSDLSTLASHDISLPYSNNVTSAPDMMLHSSKPGTYIIKLSQDTNEETCGEIKNQLYQLLLITSSYLVFDIFPC